MFWNTGCFLPVILVIILKRTDEHKNRAKAPATPAKPVQPPGGAVVSGSKGAMGGDPGRGEGV